jgi:hypothetical protein
MRRSLQGNRAARDRSRRSSRISGRSMRTAHASETTMKGQKGRGALSKFLAKSPKTAQALAPNWC